jgi:DNA ligase-associated metallophosphoesterase
MVDSEAGDLSVVVNGETLLLDSCGAMFLPLHRTLVVADLHFEKGSAYARGGQFLPPYDTAVTLERLRRAVTRHRPIRIVALGDSFHDGDAARRMGEAERAALAAVAAEWVWIAGNHDPVPPRWVDGMTAREYRLGGLIFRHEPQPVIQPGEIAGHLHPCATVAKWGRSVRRRCFVSDGVRLVMPSFGAYTGGLDVGDPAIGTLFGGRFHAYMLGHSRVYAIARQRR